MSHGYVAQNFDQTRLRAGDSLTVRVDLEKDSIAFVVNVDTPLIAWIGWSRDREIPHDTYHFAIEPSGKGYAVTIASFE